MLCCLYKEGAILLCSRYVSIVNFCGKLTKYMTFVTLVQIITAKIQENEMPLPLISLFQVTTVKNISKIAEALYPSHKKEIVIQLDLAAPEKSQGES